MRSSTSGPSKGDHEASMTTRVHSRLGLPQVKAEHWTSRHALHPEFRVPLSSPTWTAQSSARLDTDNGPTGSKPFKPSKPRPCITPCSTALWRSQRCNVVGECGTPLTNPLTTNPTLPPIQSVLDDCLKQCPLNSFGTKSRSAINLSNRSTPQVPHLKVRRVRPPHFRSHI